MFVCLHSAVGLYRDKLERPIYLAFVVVVVDIVVNYRIWNKQKRKTTTPENTILNAMKLVLVCSFYKQEVKTLYPLSIQFGSK